MSFRFAKAVHQAVASLHARLLSHSADHTEMDADPAAASGIDNSNVASSYRLILIMLSVALGVLLFADAGCSCVSMRAMKWSALELVFLPTYVICASADWLQGPYVYALYASYGFDRATLNLLFMIGFLSAMLLAPFAGGFADRHGRRAACLYGYCGIYGLACLTKHFRSLPLLLLGRVLGGAATSVLFSAFESWLVGQHEALQLDPNELSGALSRMYFCNGLSGILMGLLAQAGVDAAPLTPIIGGSGSAHGSDGKPPLDALVYVGGDVTPFDLSLAFLILGGLLMRFTWSENYASGFTGSSNGGGGSGNGRDSPTIEQAIAGSWSKPPAPAKPMPPIAMLSCLPAKLATFLIPPGGPLAMALEHLSHDPLLLLFMACSATMESAMYAFVLEWTPAVGSTAGEAPLGIIFAAFMVAYMGGSTCVEMLVRSTSKTGLSPATILVALAFVALAALFTAFILLAGAPAGDEKPPAVAFAVFLALCCFEFSLGAYMPTIASLKANYVPEGIRATVYSLFRVPLNLIVVIILTVSLSSSTTFLLCSCLLAVCLVSAVFALRLVNQREAQQKGAYTGELQMPGRPANEQTPLRSGGASSC